MGNNPSASSTRGNTRSLPEESNRTPSSVPNIVQQDVNDTSEVNQPPTENQDGYSPSHIIQRRRSFMRFPSLRKRPRSIAGPGDESLDPQAHGSASPPRRRWRAFSGLKSRPTSTLATSSSPAPDLQSQDALQQPIADSTPCDKGKERERDVAETVPDNGSNDLQAIDSDRVSGPSFPENTGNASSSSSVMLQELRDFQDSLSTRNEQSEMAVDSKMETDAGSSRSQVERPPTPIPSSGMHPTSGSQGSDAPDNGSHSALVETLGSWMSGRPRTESTEPVLNDGPIASSSRPYSLGSSSTYPSARPRHYHESNSYRTSQAAGALGSPVANTAPEPPVPGNGVGQSSSSPRGPTLPPTGTGTLVVVQGVVHTTDVRHSHTRTPSTSRPATISSTTPSRSGSLTPTLRTPTLESSRSGSGASTPQPPSTPRRGRFSSLASGLRHRSRPHTPNSLRTAGPGIRRHDVGDASSGSIVNSEIAPERPLGLGLAVAGGVSDSETGWAALSTSSSPSGAVDDTSPTEQGERQASEDSVASQGDLDIGNGGGNTEASANASHIERGAAEARERDGNSDEEGEAELSASSIEILGTLLSVATAATAASLVTGTTEPLFSSGLAGPPASGRNPTPPTQSGQTTNPAPPLSRSNHPSTSQTSTVGAESGPEAVANTRMRAAWESLRDRFSRTRGRRGGTANDIPGEPREDPREQMLREMARVFNMGLGLDAEGSTPEQQDDGANEAPPSDLNLPESSRPLPETISEPSNEPTTEPAGTGADPGPEGSFERFLHNLQVDLRTALTEDYAARRARAQARSVASSSDLASTQSPPVDTVTPILPDSIPAPASEDCSNPEIPLPSRSSEILPQTPDLIPTVPNTPRTANLDLPHLPGDNDSQFAEGSRTPPQAQGITGQPGAGINWWRLYRFPPMQLGPHPSTTSTDTASAAGVPSAPRPSASSRRSSRTSRSERQPPLTEGSLPPPGSEGTQNVVPVIVVGLQSVPVSRVEAHHHDPPSPIGNRSNEPSPSTDMPRDGPARDRAWPMRAASRAFNRMGRRTDADFPSDSDTHPPNVNVAENIGSETRRIGRQSGRTYLIFVIGGYYPPNHSIVTGADDMNSFEALWELADLLGQVKPPVASKEDIENSGLEIIKPSNLPEYEKSGKVASNTIERCLICLDDYEPENDLRLLTCRHVFHKLCVDRWLEQGRNNCPACRSKGVQTGDDLPTSPSPMAGVPFEAPP
ncbi:hypothetical protein JB92DRAFT_3013445 [Gautieria morchelliformis]|nr:hypothetical protein JB92DRAFT_3013445 [Gautieria morchelliformis]